MAEEKKSNPSRLLIVFAKTPAPGQVKTRIGEVVGKDRATMIYKQMLEKILTESASNAIWRQVIAITPESDAAYFTRRGLEVMPQSGDGLGERMSNALLQGVHSGATQLILVGSDIPTLTGAEIAEAFSLLNTVPAVIGPSADGGFYLFGIAAQHCLAAARVLKEDIKWSTHGVLVEVQKTCQRNSLPLSYLSVKRDIDTYEDWLDYKSVQAGEA